MDISSLDESLLRYCNRGLADSTQRTYKSGINRYLSFCRLFGVSTPFPVSEPLLCYFVTYLAREGVAPSTVRTYLAAVRHAQIMRGHPGPRELSSLPRLRLVQNGVRRERALTGQPQTRQRLPITPTILRQIRPLALRQGTSAGFQETLVWTAATVCFFGFFRAGEITVPTTSAFDAATHLSWGDVAIDVTGMALRVFLKRSKTDQYGRGTEVFLGATGNDLCPVEAVRAYVANRGAAPGAFFCTEGGAPLTKARFVELVRSALTRAGVPVVGYSGHSFRIGAATTAAQARIPDSTTQALGRWTSPAFLEYIRTPREHLAQFSGPLARRS